MSEHLTATADASPQSRGDAQYATFHVHDLFFGVDVLEVQEILREQAMTPVPLAPGEVEGLINLRGQIVTALDMRRRLEMEPRPDGAPALNVVVQTAGGAVSLLVDDIGDVIEGGGAHLEPPPENLAATTRALIRGILKLEDRLLLVLNVERTAALEASPTAPPHGHPAATAGASPCM
jgi:purine-binding chemotaxis protein CheW